MNAGAPALTQTSPIAWQPPARHGSKDGQRTLTVVATCPTKMSPSARDLVEHHLPLVAVLVAERLRHLPAHVRRDDLMSAGMLALVLSAGAYDPTRGVPFRRYADFRIRGALIDELRAMDWASRTIRSRAREIEAVRAELTHLLDRPPEAKDIADALGMSTRDLDTVHVDLARGTVLSLHHVSADKLPGSTNHPDTPESLLLRREQLGYLHDAVAALPERLRFVVVAHFFEQRKMIDIAIDLSVTQSRVSQLCSEALALVRDGMNSQLNPDAVRSMCRAGRAWAARDAYYQALTDRTTVAGRLDMSTAQGDMCREAETEHLEPTRESRTA